jgi:hypothetical protein
VTKQINYAECADAAFAASAKAGHHNEQLLEAWAEAEHTYQTSQGLVTERRLMSWTVYEEIATFYFRRTGKRLDPNQITNGELIPGKEHKGAV